MRDKRDEAAAFSIVVVCERADGVIVRAPVGPFPVPADGGTIMGGSGFDIGGL